MTTRVFYREPTVKNGQPVRKETELEFVQWTPRFLVVKYPAGSLRAGDSWMMGRKLVNDWLRLGVLKIEGDIPDWALIV